MTILNLQSSPFTKHFSKDNLPLPRSAPLYDWLSTSATKISQTLSAFFARPETESDKKVRTFSPPHALQDTLSVKKITGLFIAALALSASPASAFCAFEGAMCLAPAPICKDSLPRGISIHLTEQPPATINKEQFNAVYETGPVLGHSDISGIMQVTPHARPSERFAMKMSAKFTDPKIGIQLVNYLLNEGITPHLVRTFDAYNFEFDTSASVIERMKKMQFLRMEWMPGDLSNFSLFSVEQRLALALQQASTLETLIGSFHIAPDSVNLGDLLYHELTDSDCFRGQVMKEMDYWRYPVYGQVFYLPSMPYILKMGDYDSWKFLSSNKKPGRFETVYYSMDEMIDKLQGHSLMIGVPKETIRDLLQRWSALPPSQASFLDFGVNCLQSAYLGDRPPEPISI